jgi:hypothetical protein
MSNGPKDSGITAQPLHSRRPLDGARPTCAPVYAGSQHDLRRFLADFLVLNEAHGGAGIAPSNNFLRNW